MKLLHFVVDICVDGVVVLEIAVVVVVVDAESVIVVVIVDVADAVAQTACFFKMLRCLRLLYMIWFL